MPHKSNGVHPAIAEQRAVNARVIEELSRATADVSRATASGHAPELRDVLDRMSREPQFLAAIAAAVHRVEHASSPSPRTVPLLGTPPFSSSEGTQAVDPKAGALVASILTATPRRGCLASVALTLRSCDSPARMSGAIRQALDDADDVGACIGAWLCVGYERAEHVHTHGLVLFASSMAMREFVASWNEKHDGEKAARATAVTGWSRAVADATATAHLSNVSRIVAYAIRHHVADVVTFGVMLDARQLTPMATSRPVRTCSGYGVEPSRVACPWSASLNAARADAVRCARCRQRWSFLASFTTCAARSSMANASSP
jgi:hypothetical protein